MLPDNQNTRLLEYLRKFQPMIFKAVRFKHPEIIETVYRGRNLNGLGDFNFSDIADAVKNVASQIVPSINGYNNLKEQIQKALSTPVKQVQTTPTTVYRPVPVVLPPTVAPQVRSISTDVPNAPSYSGFFGIPPLALVGGAALLIGGAVLLFRKKSKGR